MKDEELSQLRRFALTELYKAARAMVVVMLHTLVSGTIILCMWLMEHFMLSLFAGKTPLFFGVDLHTIMLGAEVTVLLVFLITATISAARTFWE